MKRISKVFDVGVKLAFLAYLIASSGYPQKKKIQVVYGKDDRLDVYQVSDPDLVRLAGSTAALFPKVMFTQQNQFLKLLTKSYGESKDLCKDEPYFSQTTGALCSSFLVAPDLVVTAGHCIADIDCGQMAFVFNYQMSGPGKNPDMIPLGEVYACKQVVARAQTMQSDYSIVRLDRPVVGHAPLTLSKTAAKKGDPLVLIGNPSGLPTKIAGGANVRRDETGYFVANLDSYGGNSGSAVFNSNSLEVVGLLVHGEEDFVMDFSRNCMRTNYVPDGGARGEDVIHIETVANALKLIK